MELIARKNFRKSYNYSIKAFPGDICKIVRRDSQFKEWMWCELNGVQAWVHSSFLQIGGDEGKFLEKYNSMELDINKGDILKILRNLNGWMYVKADSEKYGWLPSSVFYVKSKVEEGYVKPGLTGEISHVELNVRELKKSVEFWGFLLTRLGYTEYQKWENGRSFGKGNSYIVFVQVENKYSKNHFNRKNIGINHISFHCSSRTLIDSIRNEAINMGYTLLHDDRYPKAGDWDEYSLFLEGPDRIKVEVVCKEGMTKMGD